MMVTREEEKRILNSIGNDVKFGYPSPEPHFQGKLKDRCVMWAPSWTDVPYWDVVDLIEYTKPEKFLALRFGYYRKSKGKLIWGSQTTLTEPIETFKELFVKAAGEKKWFKDFLEGVLNEVKQSKQST